MPIACRCNSRPAPAPITQTMMATNWRCYGLSQSRGRLPSGPVTLMVHMASVWVPFTSESKEAIAGYPEIQKELRLALQAVGRKLGMYLRRRNRVKHEGQRRAIFLRYLGEVARRREPHQRRPTASSSTSGCLDVARKKTAAGRREARRPRPAGRGRDDDEFGKNVLIVPTADEPQEPMARRGKLMQQDA